VLVRELIRRGSHRDHRWSDDELAAYADVLRAPERARASSAIYRTFLTREAGPLATGRYGGRRLAMPALMLTGAADPVVGPALIAGLDRHAGAGARTEVVERAGHFLPEERPEAVLGALRAHIA
jgi:pimeloyl-ACP methyl ester carboxylesterase